MGTYSQNQIMSAYKYLEMLYRHKSSDMSRFLNRVRSWEYRQLPAVCAVNVPTRVEKARKLGYKATPGYCVFRVRVRKGDKVRQVKKGIVYGKPRNAGVHQQKSFRGLQLEAERMAEQSIAAGTRILNSYYVAKDGIYKYYEVLAVHPGCENIRRDPKINWICDQKHRNRAQRGITQAGQKNRGLRTKRKGTKHAVRPSKAQAWKRSEKIHLRRF